MGNYCAGDAGQTWVEFDVIRRPIAVLTKVNMLHTLYALSKAARSLFCILYANEYTIDACMHGIFSMRSNSNRHESPAIRQGVAFSVNSETAVLLGPNGKPCRWTVSHGVVTAYYELTTSKRQLPLAQQVPFL